MISSAPPRCSRDRRTDSRPRCQVLPRRLLNVRRSDQHLFHSGLHGSGRCGLWSRDHPFAPLCRMPSSQGVVFCSQRPAMCTGVTMRSTGHLQPVQRPPGLTLHPLCALSILPPTPPPIVAPHQPVRMRTPPQMSRLTNLYHTAHTIHLPTRLGVREGDLPTAMLVIATRICTCCTQQERIPEAGHHETVVG